ncbi:MAG: hypothetical protein ACFFER_16780 [Candidatus Thorarchaeota archaeon]
MTFDTEQEMYDIVEKWLRHRKQRPCSHVVLEFNYDYADRSRFADVMGMYRELGYPFFVGVEVKLYKDDLGVAVRQARRLQSFCHEVYVAIPKDQFNNMSENERDDYLNLLYDNQVGLLLIKKRGMPDIELDTRPTMFKPSRYGRAVEYFREYFEEPEKDLSKGVLGDELCEIVLNDFLHTNVYGDYDFLGKDWWYNYDAGSSWLWSEYGYVTIENQRLLFEAKVFEPGKAIEKLLNSPEQISRTIAGRLKKLHGPVVWSKRGLAKSPRLTAYYTRSALWSPLKSRRFLAISIDLGFFVNSTMAYSIGEFLQTRSIHRMFIEGELSRNVLVVGGGITGSRHYAEDLRDMFDVLYKIARDLDG